MDLKFGNIAFGKKGYLGIDLGSYAIKIAEIEDGNPPILRSFGQIKLPEGGFWTSDSNSTTEIAGKIKELLDNLKIKHKKAIVSVSSYTSILKRIKIDVSPDQDLDEAILEEAEAHIPFDLDEVYLDYQILTAEEEKVDYILAAAKKEVIDTIADFIKQIKLDLIAIDIDNLALVNIFTYLYRPEDCYALIDIGASKTSIILTNREDLVMTRDISIGTKQIDYKDENKDLYNTERLIKGIEETLEFFKNSTDIEPKNIYITGGGSLNKNITKKIRQVAKTQLSFVSINPKINCDKIEKNTQTYLNHIGLIAIGLALRELEK